MQIGTIAVLMCALFRFNLVRLWGKTNPINGQDSNWQHSVFVPLIGLYYLYIHREELLRAKAKLSWSGLPIMLLGILLFLYGIYPGQNDYIKDFGMVVTIFGTVAFMAGWQVMKIAWFPIAFLVVALPWPELVYSKFAWPLQKLAASAAVGTLRAFGIEATNFGTKIAIYKPTPGEPPRVLNVAEACAGLRSLMTFVMVAGTVAFLSSRAMWERLVITAAAVPVAIFCNVVRVSGQGLLDHYKGAEWSEGFAHQFVGLVMLIPGFFLILLVGWVLDKMFIEEVDRGKLKLAGANSGAIGGGTRSIPEQKASKREALPHPVPAKQLPGAPAPAAVAAPGPSKVDVDVAPGARLVTPPPSSLKGAAPKPLPGRPGVAGAPATPVSSGLKPSVARPRAAVQAPGLKPSLVPPTTAKPVQKPVQNPNPAAGPAVKKPVPGPAKTGNQGTGTSQTGGSTKPGGSH